MSEAQASYTVKKPTGAQEQNCSHQHLTLVLDKPAVCKDCGAKINPESFIDAPKANEPTFLQVIARVRWWEDATVNGIEDAEGNLIPARDGNAWSPIIDLKTGIIQNWQQGVSAEVHYKICDDGEYFLLNSDYKQIAMSSDPYVPEVLCIGEKGYGDYIILSILENGQIKNWEAPEICEKWDFD